MTMNTIPAIDMWAPIVGTPEIIRQAAEHFPDRMLGYLRVFFKHTPTREQIAQLRAFEQTEEQLLAALDAAGITRSLITGFDEGTSAGETFMPNEVIAPAEALKTAAVSQKGKRTWR